MVVQNLKPILSSDLLVQAASFAEQALLLTANHVLALGAIGAGVFALAEILSRTSKIKDPRIGYLAEQLAAPADQIVPIADGFQLWRDARRLRDENRPEISQEIPPGAPTLMGTYLALTSRGLVLICIHRIIEGQHWLDSEEPGSASAVDLEFRPISGLLVPNLIYFNIDEDIIRKTGLVEALARGKFGHDIRGQIQPLILVTGRSRNGEMAHPTIPISWRTTRDGVKLDHLDMNKPGALMPYQKEDPARPVDLRDASFYYAFADWVRRQPARVTRPRKIFRRLAFGACCAVAWALQGPGIADQTFQQLVELTGIG